MRLHLPALALLVAIASLDASVAYAQSLDCQSVRRTRSLARAAGLDAPNLILLERSVCGGISDLRGLLAFARPSEDCLRVTTMYALAATVGSEDLAMIDGTRVAVCRTGNLGELDEWPNGRRIRSGTSWVYPSGHRFSGVGRSLLYPSGETARRQDGTWQYPSGRAVDPSVRLFHLPDGGRVESERELLAWTCARVGAERCEAVLDEFPAAWSSVRGALVTMLAWEARDPE